MGHLWHLRLTIKISGDYKAGRRYISVLSDNLVASLIILHTHTYMLVCMCVCRIAVNVCWDYDRRTIELSQFEMSPTRA